MKVLELEALEFAACVKPGDRIAWGQAGAEPLALTRALMAQRAAIGRFSAFIGITWSDMVNPDHADHVRFTSYCGAGHNRRLAKAGLLDVLPCHYSQLPDSPHGTLEDRRSDASGRRLAHGNVAANRPIGGKAGGRGHYTAR